MCHYTVSITQLPWLGAQQSPANCSHSHCSETSQPTTAIHLEHTDRQLAPPRCLNLLIATTLHASLSAEQPPPPFQSSTPRRGTQNSGRGRDAGSRAEDTHIKYPFIRTRTARDPEPSIGDRHGAFAVDEAATARGVSA